MVPTISNKYHREFSLNTESITVCMCFLFGCCVVYLSLFEKRWYLFTLQLYLKVKKDTRILTNFKSVVRIVAFDFNQNVSREL